MKFAEHFNSITFAKVNPKMHDAGSKTMTATKLVKPNVKFQTLTHNTVKFTFPPGEKREIHEFTQKGELTVALNLC